LGGERHIVSVEKGLLQLVAEDAGVDALVDGKVYWILAPKGAAVPYVVLSTVLTKDSYAMEGVTGLREGLFQVDCYATAYYPSRDIAKAVRDLLKNFIGTLPDTDSTKVEAVFIDKDWDMPYQEGAKGFVYRAMLHFRVHYIDA
jgi:hypothetical protein